MKPDNFDKDLKRIAGDFNLPVRSDLFEGVMNTRKKKRRRVIAFYLGAIIFAAAGIFSLLYMRPGSKQTAVKQQVKAHVERSQENVINSNTVAQEQENAESEQRAKSMHEPTNTANETVRIEDISLETVKENRPVSSPPPPSKTNKTAHRSSASVSDRKELIAASGSASNTVAAPVSKPQKTNPEESIPPVAPALENKEGLTAAENNKPDVKEIPVADSVSVLAAADSSSNPPVADATPKLKAEQPRRIEAGVYSSYFAVTNAINSTSLIPLDKPDSFGLSDKANYAFSAGVKCIYHLNAAWGISTGIGINKLRFDKIRIAEVKVDSLTAFEITNNGNLKGLRAFNQNLTEQSFTWLEIPLGVTYSIPLGNKVSFCAETGIVYQALLQSKAYEFTTSSAGDLQYAEKTNTGFDRLNKNVFAFYLQPGITISLGKRLNLFTGLSYRNQFVSYYKDEYFKTGSLYFIGASCNLTYKF